MSTVWGTKEAPSELSEIEVDEVSLVDRPATGRRFVLFKRGGLLRRPARTTNENICSAESERVEKIEKAAAEAAEQISGIREAATEMERRVAALEASRAPRQSQESAVKPAGLWAGIL